MKDEIRAEADKAVPKTEGDQPLPSAGREDVLEALLEEVKKLEETWRLPPGSSEVLRPLLEARVELGVKRYGRRLQTFNGRSAPLDLVCELLDGAMYGMQLGLELQRLNEELAGARARIAELEQKVEDQRLVIRAQGRSGRPGVLVVPPDERVDLTGLALRTLCDMFPLETYREPDGVFVGVDYGRPGGDRTAAVLLKREAGGDLGVVAHAVAEVAEEENATARRKQLAAEFLLSTGISAPGEPALRGDRGTYAELRRRGAWEGWLAKRGLEDPAPYTGEPVKVIEDKAMEALYRAQLEENAKPIPADVRIRGLLPAGDAERVVETIPGTGLVLTAPAELARGEGVRAWLHEVAQTIGTELAGGCSACAAELEENGRLVNGNAFIVPDERHACGGKRGAAT